MAAAGGKEGGTGREGVARGAAKAGSREGGGSPGLSRLTASWQITLETARYKEYAVNNLLLKYRY
ncbi:MAG: hypothetical protein ACM3MB_11440 [Acidobacteriota bacterium]